MNLACEINWKLTDWTDSQTMRKVVLVVPDPASKKTRLDLQQGTHHDWVLTHLPRQQFHYLKGIKYLDGLIFDAQDSCLDVPADHVMVHIHEVVSTRS